MIAFRTLARTPTCFTAACGSWVSYRELRMLGLVRATARARMTAGPHAFARRSAPMPLLRWLRLPLCGCLLLLVGCTCAKRSRRPGNVRARTSPPGRAGDSILMCRPAAADDPAWSAAAPVRTRGVVARAWLRHDAPRWTRGPSDGRAALVAAACARSPREDGSRRVRAARAGASELAVFLERDALRRPAMAAAWAMGARWGHLSE